MVGNKLTKSMAHLNPKTLTWTVLPETGKSDFNAEEGWTLLADGSDPDHGRKGCAELGAALREDESWSTAGSTIVDLHSPSPFGCLNYGPNGNLCYYPPGEIGPAILRPDGTVFATGSNSSTGSGAGHTAIYNTTTGSGPPGRTFPTATTLGTTLRCCYQTAMFWSKAMGSFLLVRRHQFHPDAGDVRQSDDAPARAGYCRRQRSLQSRGNL